MTSGQARGRILVVASLVVAAALTRGAEASGFKVQQGGPSLGNAGAGTPASAEDPSTVWFNPAGMTRLEGNQAATDVNAVVLDVPFRDSGSSNTTGLPLSYRRGFRGGDGRNGGGSAVFPSFYFVTHVDERLALGIAVNTPFGLVTDYGPTWVGRYHATHTSLQTVNINPSAAYRVTDSLSVGVGANVQYAKADEENAVDFGVVSIGLLGPGQAHLQGVDKPEGLDGRARLVADDFGFGANAGVLWDADEKTRVGFAWRSQVAYRLGGEATFVVPPSVAHALRTSGEFHDTGATAGLTVPESLSVGATHALSKEWALLGGVDWTRWSRFKELRVRFDNRYQADSVTPERWHDVYRFSLGATWRPDPAWTFRAGVAYDQSPVANRYRTPRLPDADRTWIALGVGHKLSETVSVDLAYVHEFLGRVSIHQSTGVAGNLNGSIKASIDFVSLQLTIGF